MPEPRPRTIPFSREPKEERHESKRIATEKVISHVDCTTDGFRTAYVTWDRSDDPFDRDGARWAMVDVYGDWEGPFDVPSCGGASWGTGIAYHDGGIAISSSGRGACQYWGPEKRIANTYTQRKTQTQHQEWGVLPSWPENEYLLPEVPLVPIACGSSSDFTDAEVLLVRRVYETFGGQHRLYFNFEPQD